MLDNAVLTLFKALPLEASEQANVIDDTDTLKYAFIFAPELKTHGKKIARHIKTITDMYGMDIEKYNQAAFYKSFKTVKDAPEARLLLDQIMHYLSTYTAEALGVYDKDSVYIPTDKLGLPAGKPLKITIIKGLTHAEIKEKVLSLIKKSVALSEESVKAVISIIKLLDIKDIDIETVQNREVKAALYDFYNILPQDAQEFLRLLIYVSTKETLIIKNTELITKIINSDSRVALDLILKYEKLYTLTPLAGIFYRYKPLFLAYKKATSKGVIIHILSLEKTSPQLIAKINKIRKLARKHHKPLTPHILDTVTSTPSLDRSAFTKALEKASIYKKVSIFNAISYRISNPVSIAYKIRNKKVYATEYSGRDNGYELSDGLEIISDDIVRHVTNKLAGRKVYIPDEVIYAFPTSEKMFLGNIPYGSSVYLGEKAIVGVHWEEQDTNRVDLDLHCVNPHISFGWDSSYRDGDIFYSGDITHAPSPNGATEAYWFGEGFRGGMLIVLNYFNFMKNNVQPFKLILDQSTIDINDREYLLSQCSSAVSVQAEITTPKEIIGLITSDWNGLKQFYFAHFMLGRGISTRISPVTVNAFQYLYQNARTQLSLNSVFAQAGALTDKSSCDIDLSLECIDKTSLLELI